MNTIINDEMSLDEKLAAIDLALQNAQDLQKKIPGQIVAPIDPADFTLCLGCQ